MSTNVKYSVSLVSVGGSSCRKYRHSAAYPVVQNISLTKHTLIQASVQIYSTKMHLNLYQDRPHRRVSKQSRGITTLEYYDRHWLAIKTNKRVSLISEIVRQYICFIISRTVDYKQMEKITDARSKIRVMFCGHLKRLDSCRILI